MKRLICVFSILAAVAAAPAGAAVINLTSVDWTAGTGGNFTGTSAATGSITATTSNVTNAGTVVSPMNWGSLLNYSISVDEGVYAGAPSNTGYVTKLNFPNSVSQFYLLFKGIANNNQIELFDADGRTITFLAGNNATYDSLSTRISAIATGTFDAVVRVDKNSGSWSQGPSAFNAFKLVNFDPANSSTGLFTAAVAGSPSSPSSVPERGGWTALAILGCTAAGIRLRRRKA